MDQVVDETQAAWWGRKTKPLEDYNDRLATNERGWVGEGVPLRILAA